MDRQRVAAVLGVVAVLAVLGASAIAVAHLRERPAAASPEPLVVRDPDTGATFEVPAEGWVVKDSDVRIYYEDDAGRPVAVVHGPAVFRDGYCARHPRGSNRGFAGFTRQSFGAWVAGLEPRRTARTGIWTTGVDRQRVRLADGSSALLRRTGLFTGGRGPCAAPGVEVAMVETGRVRLVLVRDTTVGDELPDAEVDRVLTSLRPG